MSAFAEMMEECHAAFNITTGSEPQSWPEMMRRHDSQRYIDAANQEILDLEALDTLEIVDKAPDGETLYSTRMLWKDKPPLNGAPARCKGRLVVRNFKSDVCVCVCVCVWMSSGWLTETPSFPRPVFGGASNFALPVRVGCCTGAGGNFGVGG